MAYTFHFASYLSIGNIPSALPIWEYDKKHPVVSQLIQCKDIFLEVTEKLSAFKLQRNL